MNSFAELPGFQATSAIERAFAEDGIEAPTAAQVAAFEPILAGQHLVLDSSTGTGKTLAYLLPLLQRLQVEPTSRVVCLAPAAELAVQTYRVACRYKEDELKAGTVVGGGNQKKQKDKITKSTRLVVGTPGRVLDLITAKKLKGVTTFVLDEPEALLTSKSAEFLTEVLSRPPRPQIVLVGATFGQRSRRLIDELMGDSAVRAKTTDNPLLERIEHQRIRVRDSGDKDLQLARFLQKRRSQRVILYVNQGHLIRHIYRNLQDEGVGVVTLSQDRTKQQCDEALRLFSRSQARVLVTTDQAAMGVDIADVPWVLHYELPRSTQAYVHRAGRTGRAGRSGTSLALVADDERIGLKRLEKELGLSFTRYGQAEADAQPSP